MIDAIDNSALNVLGRGRDENLLGAALEVGLGFFAIIEGAGAFQDNIDARPVEIVEVAGRHDLHRPAAEIHLVARHADLIGEATMDAVIFQKVRVGLDRTRGVDLDDLNIIAPAFSDLGQGAATNTAKPVDTDRDGHGFFLLSDFYRVPMWNPGRGKGK